jgi:hypothetical protein
LVMFSLRISDVMKQVPFRNRERLNSRVT